MQQLFDLSGKTALVTGASSGFGWQFARVLAGAGARVVACARRGDRLEQLCAAIAADNGTALGVATDVSDADSIANAFDVAERKYSTVQILVNNAGISRPAFLTDMDEADWDSIQDVNLKAVWRVAKEAAGRMRQAGLPGSIINIGSVLSFGTGKMLGAYMASKAGVIQLTRAMALEWAADNIRVNALAPGYFPTEMSGNFFATEKGREMISRIPQQRIGKVEELGGPLLLLASDASSFMTGSVLTVDGGHLCQSL
ncbi:MAG: glucose 1-dehydrogenase [Gammaproteobacteria bacterium]|jgi:NAD(P)-dependent dehydrogenase (short-subunit alcohol dehydrogenase family)|nr:glucose 1-dehydrogenase [Gammaproteobacteria bacterium]MDP6616571.1 glucose 1-dehydrogenase [Gammaproteobacteria bacterium]